MLVYTLLRHHFLAVLAQNGQKKKLETQLWNIADSLRGKMNADEFRDYCLGFIFYKYLSERQHLYANEILAEDRIDFLELDESSDQGQEQIRSEWDETGLSH
ncbi:type I restriction-modification system subunit M N-terminal domain-containing protein [Nostoc sp.]|uniref:type I restriction-modification system subunit M N-terminal domain-containing protein n=1 Tax=Nostoc sp. TaxID=1180 RepID=UPI002FF6AA6D